LPLYFPRSPQEELYAAQRLPADVGNDDGEPVIAERKIRIAAGPAVSKYTAFYLLHASLEFVVCDKVEQGLTSHQTHYRSYQGRVSTGMRYLSALKVCSRWGAIQIHVYFNLPMSRNVIVGLAERNDSLSPALWLMSLADWLPSYWEQLRALCFTCKYGSTFTA